MFYIFKDCIFPKASTTVTIWEYKVIKFICGEHSIDVAPENPITFWSKLVMNLETNKNFDVEQVLFQTREV